MCHGHRKSQLWSLGRFDKHVMMAGAIITTCRQACPVAQLAEPGCRKALCSLTAMHVQQQAG